VNQKSSQNCCDFTKQCQIASQINTCSKPHIHRGWGQVLGCNIKSYTSVGVTTSRHPKRGKLCWKHWKDRREHTTIHKQQLLTSKTTHSKQILLHKRVIQNSKSGSYRITIINWMPNRNISNKSSTTNEPFRTRNPGHTGSSSSILDAKQKHLKQILNHKRAIQNSKSGSYRIITINWTPNRNQTPGHSGTQTEIKIRANQEPKQKS